ncbi:hypothetical protein C8J56DRAFT_1166867, partial [Mycena floridula]
MVQAKYISKQASTRRNLRIRVNVLSQHQLQHRHLNWCSRSGRHIVSSAVTPSGQLDLPFSLLQFAVMFLAFSMMTLYYGFADRYLTFDIDLGYWALVELVLGCIFVSTALFVFLTTAAVARFNREIGGITGPATPLSQIGIINWVANTVLFPEQIFICGIKEFIAAHNFAKKNNVSLQRGFVGCGHTFIDRGYVDVDFSVVMGNVDSRARTQRCLKLETIKKPASVPPWLPFLALLSLGTGPPCSIATIFKLYISAMFTTIMMHILTLILLWEKPYEVTWQVRPGTILGPPAQVGEGKDFNIETLDFRCCESNPGFLHSFVI